ncbi:zinc finger domain-containing protein [Mumia sp. DW29H23]|uniref:zinc finger domain-containing protein n=1 Tax=Mumia sp. DW29H23 TaxID=3421241 RepID=UPI003D692C48
MPASPAGGSRPGVRLMVDVRHTVDCPVTYCQARPGQSCITIEGGPRRWPHDERERVASAVTRGAAAGRKAAQDALRAALGDEP